MSAALTIVSAGAYASVQDKGRFGFRRIGVPCSGTLDPNLLAIANALAGNPAGHPAIECFDGGQQFEAKHGAVRVAIAGDVRLEITGPDGPRAAAAWRSHVLEPGDTLRIIRMERGRIALLAVSGLVIPRQMNSASTYVRAGLGGWQGRALHAGDRLPAAAADAAPARSLPRPPEYDDDPIRLVLGPQHTHFDAVARETFLGQTYTVSAATDRMGIRLNGEPIRHDLDRGQEIVSDAIVPGAIQVPGNGLPIVLLADAQTAGGYPKIATVITTDLPRLAARRPGEQVRFVAISAAEGESAARQQATKLADAIASIRLIAGEGVDLRALYQNNLVGGVVDAINPEYIPLHDHDD
ncbi:biotin-dependent carboxyltransferase family protein [Rhodocyclaceae bacterium SMB388]